MILEIVILAMIAAFLGLRLYSVLGRRAEHEEESIPQRFEPKDNAPQQAPTAATAPQAAQPRPVELEGAQPVVENGIREIAAVDRSFEFGAFIEGARGAYEMVLEAFWKGDKETLRDLCDDDVYAGFEAAINQREAEGLTLDNKLVRIEETRVHSATLETAKFSKVARIAVLFVADIAAVTRDKDGNVVAGSLDDAIESRDIWTFSRDVSSRDPNWILDETDQG